MRRDDTILYGELYSCRYDRRSLNWGVFEAKDKEQCILLRDQTSPKTF